MLEVGRMEGGGECSAAMSANESASHLAAWAVSRLQRSFLFASFSRPSNMLF
eukprot:SAG22_NODE_63_length_23302_cov_17.506551_7_plen_52_part_00